MERTAVGGERNGKRRRELQERDPSIAKGTAIKDRTAEIKAEFPYTMKEFVRSPKKIEERRAELEESIKRSNETLAAYAAKIEEMLG
jgi:hypothetical protein